MSRLDSEGVYEHYLRFYCRAGFRPSELGTNVALLLEAWMGLNHICPRAMKSADWVNSRFIALRMDQRLATFDFDRLTRLVFLAHDRCIRIEIEPCNMRYMRLLFHPRSREAGYTERHPTIEQALAQWRANNPAPVPIKPESVVSDRDQQITDGQLLDQADTLLLLAWPDDTNPPSLKGLSNAELNAICDWAGLVHLEANDNDCEAGPAPECLRKLLTPDHSLQTWRVQPKPAEAS